MNKPIVIYVTASSRKEADRIAEQLVRGKLAACVTIVPEIASRYWWNGRIENGRELLLIIKSFQSKYKAIESCVRTLHSYTVPEILAIPVSRVNVDYLKWMKDSLR